MRERHAQAARVARDVVQFLDEHGAQAAEAHQAAFLSSASIMATKTSSMEGAMGSRRSMAMPLAASAWRMRGAGCFHVVHGHVQAAAEYGHVQHAGQALQGAHGFERLGGVQVQQTVPVSPSFNSGGVPSAITLPRYISARRWQYSASSM